MASLGLYVTLEPCPSSHSHEFGHCLRTTAPPVVLSTNFYVAVVSRQRMISPRRVWEKGHVINLEMLICYMVLLHLRACARTPKKVPVLLIEELVASSKVRQRKTRRYFIPNRELVALLNHNGDFNFD